MNEPDNGFRAPLVEELAPLFPSYRIMSLIAMGGMGAVYHAIQTSLDREVAIKILPVEFGDDREFCESFEAEAKAMARLNHPNLIGVFDFGEVNGMLFIVMEYVPGQSLHAACNGSALDPAEVVRLMSGISRGLAHAHEQGILHRDIKPANILLDSNLKPKIGDFGLARPVDTQVQEGETVFGTPGYTAPEVLDPSQTVDQRADIYSLGVLLHELLTGLLPDGDPRPPSMIAHCDPRFDAVVRKATSQSPLQRYQSGAEIAEVLEEIGSTAGPGVLKTAAPAGYKPPAVHGYSRQLPKKGSGGILVTVLLVAVVLVFIFRDGIFHMADPGPDPAPVVDHQPEPVEPEPAPVVDHQPEPVEPEPPPVVNHQPEPVEPEPPPVVDHQPEPVEPEPVPVTRKPKFDVEGFLAHAKSVMVDRCGPDIVKRDEALEANLADFEADAWKLLQQNLQRHWHDAARSELSRLVGECKENGNRMNEELKGGLKRKKYVVELHEEYQNKEAKIDGEMASAFAKHEKTYLYGLGLKIDALQKADDPGAVDLIKAEVDKMAASTEYFSELMLEANGK